MRKLVVGNLVLGLGILGGGVGGFGQGLPTPRGELRIVDTAPGNWGTITINVFEHLVELDKTGMLVPRLATSWRWLDDRTVEFKLRPGVTFHNGEIFDAETVKLAWDENTRLRQPYSAGANVNFEPGSTLRIIDRHTVRFSFPEPDGAALVKLSILHLGNPVGLSAVNKAVTFVPHVNGDLVLAETSVTDRHWSVRPGRRMP